MHALTNPDDCRLEVCRKIRWVSIRVHEKDLFMFNALCYSPVSCMKHRHVTVSRAACTDANGVRQNVRGYACLRGRLLKYETKGALNCSKEQVAACLVINYECRVFLNVCQLAHNARGVYDARVDTSKAVRSLGCGCCLCAARLVLAVWSSLVLAGLRRARCLAMRLGIAHGLPRCSSPAPASLSRWMRCRA